MESITVPMDIITGQGKYTHPKLVDDYEMMDGTKFDWNNAAQKADPYANRDPRFYATILYDGAPGNQDQVM